MNFLRQIGYLYWLALGILLAIALFSNSPLPLLVAIGIGFVQCIHYLILCRRLSAFPAQVRFAYLGALVVGYLAGGFTVAALLVGTITLLLFDYCPLARMVWLMPWNRTRPITWGVVWWAFAARPATFEATTQLSGTRSAPAAR
jgi:hypothetical protein